MWLSWEQGLEGKEDEGAGGGVGSNARIPAPILRQCRILNFINLYHPEYRFILIFPHGLANPASWLSAQILYPLKTFWEFPNHTLYFGQIPDHENALSFRPRGKFDLSIKRSRNFLNSFSTDSKSGFQI